MFRKIGRVKLARSTSSTVLGARRQPQGVDRGRVLHRPKQTKEKTLPKYRNNKRGVLGMVLLAAIGLLVASTAPASAVWVETGAGTGEGETTAGTNQEDPALVPLCVEAPSHTFEFDNDGTYTATNTTQSPTTATYDGPTKTTVVTARYWFNPQGTFGETGTLADGTCTVPAPVPVTVKVEERGTNPGTVRCPTTGTANGLYSRVGEAFVVTFDAKCAVTDSTVTTLSRTSEGLPTHTIEGGQHPCFPDGPPPDPCSIVAEFSPVTYSET